MRLFSGRCHSQNVKQCKENPLPCRRYTLELLPTCENIGLQSHLGPRNSQAHSSAPNLHPRHSPSYSHSRTPAAPRRPPATPRRPPNHTSIRPQTHPSLRTHTPDIPPTPPSSAPHTPSPPQSRMQFPNRSDSATQSDTNKQASQRELHAKLQHLRPLAGPVATRYGGHRAQAATHPDR